MAVEFKSAQRVLAEEARPNSDKSDTGAKVRVNIYTYVGTGDEVATDFITLGTLKAGWRLLGMRATAPATFAAATGTIALGIAGTAAKYMAATDAAAALSADGNHTDALFRGAVLAADEDLRATFGTAGAGAGIAGPLVVEVYYTRG